MTEVEEKLEAACQAAFLSGAREAATAWAWWKDGKEWVGGGSKTLQQAFEIIETWDRHTLAYSQGRGANHDRTP